MTEARSVEGWVPLEKRTTAYYLFNPRFKCRVAYNQSMSSDYMRFHGMPSTGVKQYDDMMANELTHRLLTINDMVEYYKLGTNIEVDDSADTKTIYGYISDHLNAWKGQLERTLGETDEELLKDLVVLDNFANLVYPHATYHFAPDVLDSSFARHFSSILSISNAMLVKKPMPFAEEEKTKPKAPERVSMRDVFVSRSKRR